jgi:V8-like Glu-specific endopeptidase
MISCKWPISIAAGFFPAAVLCWAAPAGAQVGDGANDAIASSVAYVVCGERQGSGALLAGPGRYVLTAGHVVEDREGGAKAATCHVGFGDRPPWQPTVYYSAEVVETVFDERSDTDFAILRLGAVELGRETRERPGFAAREDIMLGDAVRTFGYPSQEHRRQESSSGGLTAFRRGALRTGAIIAEGYSGGPVLSAAGEIVGISSRIIYREDRETGESVVEAYEAIDLLSVEYWLDAFRGGHDGYFQHADASAMHSGPPPVRSSEPGCEYLVRTAEDSAVYCLLPGDRRLAFPDVGTYGSWFEDFSLVARISSSDLAAYRLVAGMTYRAGSLVKLRTDARVYYVADDLGTLRWVPSEDAAARYFGPFWAMRVRDVSDAFFSDYRIGRPLD